MTALLRDYPDLEVVATADLVESGRQLLENDGFAQVVLFDLRLGQKSGLELLADRDSSANGPAVVVLTAFDNAEYVAAACRLGASGFVLKTAPIAQLVEAIRLAAAGVKLAGVAFRNRLSRPANNRSSAASSTGGRTTRSARSYRSRQRRWKVTSPGFSRDRASSLGPNWPQGRPSKAGWTFRRCAAEAREADDQGDPDIELPMDVPPARPKLQRC